MTTIAKNKGDSFVITLTVKNTGNGTGTWDLNVQLDGSAAWNWIGIPILTVLKAGESIRYMWSGLVPSDAGVGQAQLSVIVDGTPYLQDWYVNVGGIPAELSFTSVSIQ